MPGCKHIGVRSGVIFKCSKCDGAVEVCRCVEDKDGEVDSGCISCHGTGWVLKRK